MEHAVGLPFELHEPAVVDDAVDGRRRNLVVSEDRPPAGELHVRGDCDRLSFAGIRECLEHEARPVAVGRQEPRFVDDEHGHAADIHHLLGKPAPSRVRLRSWRRQSASTALCTSSPLAGMALAEVMCECDLGKSTLDRWIERVYECGPTAAADNRAPAQKRLIVLDRVNARLKMEVDALKQAALISARK